MNPSNTLISPTRPDARREAIVARWVEAYNDRDLSGMLAYLADGIVFHPLRVGGLKGCYRGHDGMREWFAELAHRHDEHRIRLSQLQAVDDTQVFAAGSLRLTGGGEISSFCGLHRVVGGRIVVMHHCLSDPDMIEQLGLIP